MIPEGEEPDEIPDETPEENPDDPSDEHIPERESENEFDDSFDEHVPDPNDKPEEINNPSNSGTITVTIPEQPEEQADPELDSEPEQTPESEPEQDPEEKSEEIELVNPEGEPMDPVDSAAAMEIRRDLEEWGYEPEVETEEELAQSPEIESESEPETDIELTPETQPDPEYIPLEEYLEQIAQGQENLDETPIFQPEEELEIKPEQNSEVIPEENSEVIPEQNQRKIQKEIHIKAKKLEPITDPVEIANYKHYEYQHIIKTKFDPIYSQKQLRKPKERKKQKKVQKKKPTKVKKLEPITDPEELGNYKPRENEQIVGTKFWKPELEPKKTSTQKKKPDKELKKKPTKVKKLDPITDPKELGEYEYYEYSPTLKPYSSQKQTQKKSEKSEKKSEMSQKTRKKSKQEEIQKLELITPPIETEKSESKTDASSEHSNNSLKTATQKQEVDKTTGISKEKVNEMKEQESDSQKQVEKGLKAKKQKKIKVKQEIESTSPERLELREKYRLETGRRPIYDKKETKGFKKWLELQKQLLQKKQDNSNKSETEEGWEQLLKKWIIEASDKEISKEIKEKLLEIIRKFSKSRTIYWRILKILRRKRSTDNEAEEIESLLRKLEDVTEAEAEFFKNLRVFEGFYNDNIIWYKSRIITQREKFLKHLAQKLKHLEKNEKTQRLIKKIWREILKENLHKNLTLSLDEKSLIIKILQIEKFTDGNKTELISILSKLPTEELVSLLGDNFIKHTKSYVKWGWDFDIGVKRLMLNDYFKKYKTELKLEENLDSIEYSEQHKKTEIKIPNFRQRVIEILKNLYRLIKGTTEQLDFIRAKSLEVLDEFILRTKNKEFYIPKDVNLGTVAATIIYTVCISNKNMPTVTMSQLSDRRPTYISTYYRKYFRHLYPRIKFRFASYPGINRIRNIISLFIFEQVKNDYIETIEIVLKLKKNILENINLPKQLTRKEIDILYKFASQHQDTFVDYFTDLVEIIKFFIISSKIHKKIDAHIIISPLAEFLNKKGINLMQTKQTFSRSVGDIYNYLVENYANFFPSREFISEDEGEEKIKAYKKIVGNKIKLYVLKNIYNGRYFKNGTVCCPKCKKERKFFLNTHTLRLNALEFHHSSHKKENRFSIKYLYKLFIKNRSNPNFLEDLINLMESEEVKLLCRCHHLVRHQKYYKYFKYLISWNDMPNNFPSNIYFLPTELIHMLIMTAVNNHSKTKNLSKNDKFFIRRQVIRLLKKRFIIEHLYGESCPTCGEFNTKNHLTAFIFHHQDGNTKLNEASKIYHLPCSEIIRILDSEKGGYICHNCHTVIHYKRIHLFDQIFDDRSEVKKIISDYNNVNKKFTLIQKPKSFMNPLDKSIYVSENLERYLSAIYELSKAGNNITTSTLKNYLRKKYSFSVLDFFKRNEIIKLFVDIEPGRPYRFILNDKGRVAISLIYHFRNYYSSK